MADDGTSTDRFHPKRWTFLTWVAILLWVWEPAVRNYPPSKSYSQDPSTGRWTVPTHYPSLAAIPFPVGWPLHYIRPSTVLPIQAVGAPPPATPPSGVFPMLLVANLLIVAATILALIYLSQRFMLRYSLLTLFKISLIFAALCCAPPLIGIVAGYRVAQWYSDAFYFSPLLAATLVKLLSAPYLSRVISRERTGQNPASFEQISSADDAIAAAARLDARGDWSDAIEMYRRTAERWPAQNEYIQNCITRVVEKQSLAQTSERDEGAAS